MVRFFFSGNLVKKIWHFTLCLSFFFEAPSRDSQGPFFFPGTKPWGRQVFLICVCLCVLSWKNLEWFVYLEKSYDIISGIFCSAHKSYRFFSGSTPLPTTSFDGLVSSTPPPARGRGKKKPARDLGGGPSPGAPPSPAGIGLFGMIGIFIAGPGVDLLGPILILGVFGCVPSGV